MTDTTPSPFSGTQYTLDNGSARAEIGSVAAVLRSLTVDGVRLTESVPLDSTPPQGCGMVLAPWPNRVRGARWEWEGEEQLLDITEPSLGGASHGLLRNAVYRAIEVLPDAVELGALVAPQHGWPFLLDTRVRYQLTPDGLTVTHSVENLSPRRAPFAIGAHPYFRVGDVPIEQLTLTVRAGIRGVLDEAFVPSRVESIDGTDGDLRAGRLLAELDLNTPYTAFDRGDEGEGGDDVAWLDAPDGSRTTVWFGPDFTWTQLYTPRDHPRPEGTGLAIAIEPMTAPPNALNSGDDLLILEPGERWSGSWGVRYAPAAPAAPAVPAR